MLERKAKINIPIGLHARPAAIFIQKAEEFASDIKVIRDNQVVSGKSILGLMTLALGYGEEITIRVEGVDEVLAVKTLVELMESFVE